MGATLTLPFFSAETGAHGSAARRHFSSVCFSADGTCVLAAGRSRFVCIYEVSQQVLLKKYQISHNRARDGVLDLLHSGNLTASGVHKEDMDVDGSEDERWEDPNEAVLPGAKRGEGEGVEVRAVDREGAERAAPAGPRRARAPGSSRPPPTAEAGHTAPPRRMAARPAARASAIQFRRPSA